MNNPTRQLDREYLLNYYKDMMDEIGELFESFLSETDENITKIMQSLYSSDLHTASETLHYIAPSFIVVGLPQLVLQLQEVESFAADNDQAKALSLMQSFYQEYTEYLPAIIEENNRLKAMKNAS